MQKFRRQFILSERAISRFPQWKSGMIAGKYHLRIHPDLDFHQARDSRNEIALLGYALDPNHPHFGNKEIIALVLQNAASGAVDIFKQTQSIGGRWLLFWTENGSTKVFADPTGLRTFFYTADPETPFQAASQAHHIAAENNYKISDFVRKDFLETKSYTDNLEYWLPCGKTTFEEVKQLVPNHYYDFDLRQQVRFWPREKKKPVGFSAGAKQIAENLENLMLAAAERFPLAISTTAGIDSRTVLAASRKIADRAKFYTLKYYHLTEEDRDIKIPRKLLEQVGLRHEVYDCSGIMDNTFEQVYMSSADLAHTAWGNIAAGLEKHYPQDYTAVKGNCSEIGRKFYYKYIYPDKINAKTLARLTKMQDSEFAIQAFDDWLQSAQPTAVKYGYDILDLFYWEHRMGGWQAASQIEWDIVQEVFTPFNSREIINLMLGVDVKHRDSATNKLHKEVIKLLWPEMLSQPINPTPISRKLTKELPKRLKGSRVFGLLRAIKRAVIR